MKLKNFIRDSLFARSLKLAKSNPGKIGVMILFDALFIISYFSLKKFFEYFSQTISLATSSSIFIFFALSSVYYLSILFMYSFFKYIILDYVKSLFGKSRFSLDRLGYFYLLNLVMGGIFLAVLLLLNFMLINIKQNYAPFVFIFLAVPYILFLYITINITHSNFYEGCSIKNSIKSSFGAVFAKIKSYGETIFALITLASLSWLLFLAGNYLLMAVASKNYSYYLTSYSSFKQASVIFFDAIFYLLLMINRISFYAVIKEDKK